MILSIPAIRQVSEGARTVGTLQSWRMHGTALLVMLAIILLTFWSTFVEVYGIWVESSVYKHGFLVVPASLWMIWDLRFQLVQQRPRLDYWALPFIVLLPVVWFVAEVLSVNIAAHMSVFAMMSVSFWLLLGRQAALIALFPLLYFLFAIPIGDAAIPYLMKMTAWAAVQALQISGIPVFWEGMVFEIPSGKFEVIAACSGVRFLISTIALSALFAYMNFYSWKKRIGFILLGTSLSIIANWARAYLVVMIAHLTDMKYGAGDDHIWYGWFFFGLVIFLLFAIGGRLADPFRKPEWSQLKPTQSAQTVERKALWLPVLAVIVFLLLPRVSLMAIPDEANTKGAELNVREMVSRSDGAPEIDLTFEDRAFSDLEQVRVALDDFSVDLIAAYYPFELGQEVGGFKRTVMYQSGWDLIGESTGIVEVYGRQQQVNVFHLKRGLRERLVWQWVMVGDAWVVTPVQTKAAQLQNVVSRKFAASSAFALRVDVEEDAQKTSAKLARFIQREQAFWRKAWIAESTHD